MKRVVVVACLLAGLLALPTVASATHMIRITGAGDCDGWTASALIQWRGSIYEGELDYTVTIAEPDGTVLETIEWSGPLTRPDDSESLMTHEFAGEWSIFAPGGDYVVHGVFHLSAPWYDTFEESTVEFTEGFYCGTVPATETNWTAVKALYR